MSGKGSKKKATAKKVKPAQLTQDEIWKRCTFTIKNWIRLIILILSLTKQSAAGIKKLKLHRDDPGLVVEIPDDARLNHALSLGAAPVPPGAAPHVSRSNFMTWLQNQAATVAPAGARKGYLGWDHLSVDEAHLIMTGRWLQSRALHSLFAKLCPRQRGLLTCNCKLTQPRLHSWSVAC